MSVHLDPETLGAGVLQPVPTTSPHQVASHHSGGRPPGVLRKVAHGVGSAFRASFFVGFSLVVGVLALERIAPIEWRPSTWLGTWAGRNDTAQILTAIEARRRSRGPSKKSRPCSLITSG